MSAAASVVLTLATCWAVLTVHSSPALAWANGFVGADQSPHQRDPKDEFNYLRVFSSSGNESWSLQLGNDRGSFTNVNEVKPRIYRNEKVFLVTASGGAARIFRVGPKSFYAWNPGISGSTNPHSMEVLPGNVLAVAATKENKIHFYGYEDGKSKTRPSSSISLKDVHGLQWHPKSKKLWAIGEGSKALISITVEGTKNPKGTVKSKADVTGKGHDLATRFGYPDELLASATYNAYRVKGGKLVRVIPSMSIKSVKAIGNFRGPTWLTAMTIAPDDVGADAAQIRWAESGEWYGWAGISNRTNKFYKIRPYYDGNYNYN
ncbi:hypothetical protein GCM10027589_34070 [Actinocorallia lasiicapitis]